MKDTQVCAPGILTSLQRGRLTHLFKKPKLVPSPGESGVVPAVDVVFAVRAVQSEMEEGQVRIDRGNVDPWGNRQGQDSVCFYSSLLAASSSSWDQLQDAPFSPAASAVGNAGCDIPQAALLFCLPSALCQTFFRPPPPPPLPRPRQMERGQDFMWTWDAGDPARHGAVFRVACQDCGSVQEQESCNLGENQARGKFGNKRTKMPVP